MFKIYDGRTEFYQWDLNQKLIVSDPTITEVHFCNQTDDCSLVCEVYEENGQRLVNVPNILLQDNWPIKVYARCDCFTKASTTYEVIARTKPADYAYTETEVRSWNELIKKVNEIEIAAGGILEVEELPTTDINSRALYRVKSTGKVYYYSGDWVEIADADVVREIERGLVAEKKRIDNAELDALEAVRTANEAKATAEGISGLANNALGIANSALSLSLETKNECEEYHDEVKTLLEVDDKTLNELQEVVDYIKSNKSLIDEITIKKVNVADIVDNLNSTATNKPLSANMGRELKSITDEETKRLDSHIADYDEKALKGYTVSEEDITLEQDGVVQRIETSGSVTEHPYICTYTDACRCSNTPISLEELIGAKVSGTYHYDTAYGENENSDITYTITAEDIASAKVEESGVYITLPYGSLYIVYDGSTYNPFFEENGVYITKTFEEHSDRIYFWNYETITYHREETVKAEGKYINLNSNTEFVALKGEVEVIEGIAKGANQAKTYKNYAFMITAFNEMPNDAFRVGQNIMIVQLNVPDLWVSAIVETSVEYSYTGDEDFVNALRENGSVQVGYYMLSALETQSVKLVEAGNGVLGLAQYAKYDVNTGRMTPGIVSYNGSLGISVFNNSSWPNTLCIAGANDKQIEAQSDIYKPITPVRLSHAVKVGITANKETLTAEEKAKATEWLGALKGYTVSETDVILENTYLSSNPYITIEQPSAYVWIRGYRVSDNPIEKENLIGAVVNSYHEYHQVAGTILKSENYTHEITIDDILSMVDGNGGYYFNVPEVNDRKIYVVFDYEAYANYTGIPFDSNGVYFTSDYSEGGSFYLYEIRGLSYTNVERVKSSGEYIDLSNNIDFLMLLKRIEALESGA